LVALILSSCQAAKSTHFKLVKPAKNYAISPVKDRTTLKPAFSTFFQSNIPIPVKDPINHLNTHSKSDATYEYVAQSGDTIQAVAARFRVHPQEITSKDPFHTDEFLTPGQILNIPRLFNEFPNASPLLPDSEVIFSTSAADFDVAAYIERADGYLHAQNEFMRSTGMTSVADILARVALENSFNPRLLLALLEYQCGCVLGYPDDEVDTRYLMGNQSPIKRGLYRQLGWTVNQLSLGYYGWRDGLINEFYFPNGTVTRIAPTLNAGSVAIQYLFAQLYDRDEWQRAVDPDEGFTHLYARMFGDPWQRDANIRPLIPGNLVQPEFILPFQPGEKWSYTSGPHKAWETEGALAALDFAPPSIDSGCLTSDEWIVAVADGLVVRASLGTVVLDLDAGSDNQLTNSPISDGNEHTEWAILYMHVAEKDRVLEGAHLQTGDPIGHPSCEGGPATGSHLHIARKYNGEWIAADGPVPFVMDGWTAKADFKPYEGFLIKDNIKIRANVLSPGSSFISREVEETSRQKRFIRQRQYHRYICD
jgi:murein DD-endopeptidase MepM/ murein hydrolase activator NlpD